MYPFTYALAPPTPTMSNAGFLKHWIDGRVGNCKYNDSLTIENADPVSTSASCTRTPSITASVTWGAPILADSTAFENFGVGFGGGWVDFRKEKFRAKCPMQPQL